MLSNATSMRGQAFACCVTNRIYIFFLYTTCRRLIHGITMKRRWSMQVAKALVMINTSSSLSEKKITNKIWKKVSFIDFLFFSHLSSTHFRLSWAVDEHMHTLMMLWCNQLHLFVRVCVIRNRLKISFLHGL